MVSIQLDTKKEQQLRRLAQSQGKDLPQLVQRIVEEYLDVQAWAADSESSWGEASVQLTTEVLGDESWDDGAAPDGSR